MAKDLAERLGISSIGLQQIMKTEKPKLDTAERLAKAIGVPVWMILLEDEEIDEIRNVSAIDGDMRCPCCGTPLRIKISK